MHLEHQFSLDSFAPPRPRRARSGSGTAAIVAPICGDHRNSPQRWLRTPGDKTFGSLFGLFEEKGFAILFVLRLGVSALPLPTGGATHVFQIIAVLLALELIAGRDQIWLPQRWRKLELAGDKQQRFITALMKMIRRLERFSRPRLRFLFDHRLSNIIFGLLVIGGSRLPSGLSDSQQRTAAGARALQAGGRPFEPGTAHRRTGASQQLAHVVTWVISRRR